ncbi:MAG: hypothetical protein K5790_09465 [Nitrosopumilus sp.]|uniref:hypothetical protein n=1 Tax=Nitrosopumilus sp. TaxID=2024843 RepID=UPI00247B399F|nr:hypothetical protein [Nitrosopumilus sp.]MCV0393498.1 hypothetical protein [Nitrosopumilus sp.]
MDIDESIKNCEIYLKQIQQYDPDPFYVNYFLNEFVNSINKITNGIFEEANRDFGLFISGKVSQKEFFEKARQKNDLNAIKFSEWFSNKEIQEHQNPIPKTMQKILEFRKKFNKLPDIKIMIRASDRYKDDIYQQIKFNLSSKKLRSKDELNYEVKRQLPIFLEIINQKRVQNNEPKVSENQVLASAFLDIEDFDDVEIAYTVKIYIPVIKRIVQDSREKIRELTTWK